MDIVHVPGAVSTETESGIAVIQESDQDNELLKSQIAEAAVKRERLRNSIKHIMGKITAMFAHLNEYNRSVQAEIAKTRAEIRAIQDELRRQMQDDAERRAREHVPDDLDAEFAKHAEEEAQYDDSRFEFAGTDEPSDTPENPDLVKLFRMIANRTHPDKTDDPELHMLFVTAKEYRQKGDYEGLKRIWDYINGQAESAARKAENELRKQLEEVMQEMSMLEQQLEYMRLSDDYRLLDAYEQDQAGVLRLSWVQMNDRLRSLTEQLRMLRQLAGKPTVRVYDYLTFGS